MAWPYTFAGLTGAPVSDLDTMFNAVGVLVIVPCAVSGTNTLSLIPISNTPTISAYSGSQVFSGVAGAANTGAVTANAGPGALPVYKDTQAGPIALAGGEIQPKNAFFLIYDAALNSGAGGFHLMTGGAQAGTKGAATTVSTAGAGTLTAAALTGSGAGNSLILRQGAPGAGFIDTTDTATAILAALTAPVVGTLFRFRVINTSGQTQTLAGGTGVTVNATNNTTATGATHDFWGLVITTGTPAITIYG